ncbi:MAG: transglutaminase-like cysteine peptidase [Rhodobacteraceae bacterium]|nr:transglutaminase-like cysteine peptidase [Paracoccaceae bacterium]
MLLATGSVKASENATPFLVPKQVAAAPEGFNGLCSRYSWACQNSRSSNLNARSALDVAQRINLDVNRATPEIEDRDQYGKAEVWALPTRRGGDCEDFALLKKLRLIEAGLPGQNLLMATVLDRQLRNHAVLVLRTENGDYVLDNLTNKIVPWQATGYTFLKLQNPTSPGAWDAVLAGGVAG